MGHKATTSLLTMMLCAGVLLVACIQEQLRPDLMIEGDYALVREDGYSNEFVRFSNGQYEIWKASKSFSQYAYAQGALWGCSSNDFVQTSQGRYSVIGQTLYWNGMQTGTISLSDGTLFLASDPYFELKSFETAAYARIVLDQDAVQMTTDASSVSVPYRVTVSGKMVPADVRVSVPEAGWLHCTRLEDGQVLLTADANGSAKSRQGTVTFSSFGAENQILTVTQPGSPLQSLSFRDVEITCPVASIIKLPGYLTTFPEDGKEDPELFNWSSDKPLVAYMGDNGTLFALTAGSALITVTDKKTGTLSSARTVTVTQGVPVFVVPKSIVVAEGQQTRLSLTTTSDGQLTASSDNPSVASVSCDGSHVTLTAVSVGKTDITVNCAETPNYKEASGTCEVTVLPVVDLSASGTANCYLVPGDGRYKFRTVKGNSSTSVGNVASAEVLWESWTYTSDISRGDLIQNVKYEDGYIIFDRITKSGTFCGNALIAAKDNSGAILWSWHIWMVKDYDPVASAQTYYRNAGTMMDRNLGAVNTDSKLQSSTGLFYQWGRKDPFVGKGKFIGDKPDPASSRSTTGTIAYATQHPTTFILLNPDNEDWLYTGTISDRWGEAKTIYDPCPEGWKVPVGGENGIWAKARGSFQDFQLSFNLDDYGFNFRNILCAQDVWYPSTGYIDGKSGVYVSDRNFSSWSYTTFNSSDNGKPMNYAFYFGSYSDTESEKTVTVDLTWGITLAFGSSVRCQKE